MLQAHSRPEVAKPGPLEASPAVGLRRTALILTEEMIDGSTVPFRRATGSLLTLENVLNPMLPGLRKLTFWREVRAKFRHLPRCDA